MVLRHVRAHRSNFARLFVGVIATAPLVILGFSGGVAGPAIAAGDSGAHHISVYDFNAVGYRESVTDGFTTTIEPVVTGRPDGSIVTTYKLPDGELLTSTTPPPGFDPLTAPDTLLAEYGFPARPSDARDLQEWTSAMAAYKSDGPPTWALQVVSDTAPAAMSAPALYTTLYGNWGGYIAGTLYTQSNTYVAAKTAFTVPSNAGTCSGSNTVGLWIGLGGTYSNGDNLDQQGIECGNPDVGSGSAYRPFTEFANTANPVAFCGYSSWTLPAGDFIYQNMSFQTSSNTAYFYLEDETSGIAHSCSASPPSGWSYDGNTAEWIAEAPTGTAIDFHSVGFTDANAELDSNSTWVTLGSQTVTKVIDGSSSSYCIAPGSIGSDQQSFTDTWYQSTC